MLFEWDESKRAANLKKHGFDLPDAVDLFDGRRIIPCPSLRNKEGRFVTLTFSPKRLLPRSGPSATTYCG